MNECVHDFKDVDNFISGPICIRCLLPKEDWEMRNKKSKPLSQSAMEELLDKTTGNYEQHDTGFGVNVYNLLRKKGYTDMQGMLAACMTIADAPKEGVEWWYTDDIKLREKFKTNKEQKWVRKEIFDEIEMQKLTLLNCVGNPSDEVLDHWEERLIRFSKGEK